MGEVKIKHNNRKVQFSKSNIACSIKGIKRNEIKRNSYSGLKELVENAVYSYTKSTDNRHSERNNGQEFYFIFLYSLLLINIISQKNLVFYVQM